MRKKFWRGKRRAPNALAASGRGGYCGAAIGRTMNMAAARRAERQAAAQKLMPLPVAAA